MNRKTARSIAEKITNTDIKQMFDNAKVGVKDWKKVSAVNKGMTKGAAWNILAKDFDVNFNYNILAKTNMVREFGNFLPETLKPKKIFKEKLYTDPTHQDPDFSWYFQ
jgi:hypothetical protein